MCTMKKVFVIIILFTCLGLFADGVAPLGTGTNEDPYQIETLNNLLWLSTNPDVWDDNAYFIQTSDIIATDTENWNYGSIDIPPFDVYQGFSPIGTYDQNFTGHYDGQGYSVTDLYIFREQYHIGLFGNISGSIVENLVIENSVIDGLGHEGGLVGTCDTSEISNCIMINIEINQNFDDMLLNIHSPTDIGGMIGDSNLSTVTNCQVSCTLKGYHNIGGIIGYNHQTPVSNSFSSGNIIGEDNIGGLIGFNQFMCPVTYCYSSCNVTGVIEVGGLIGDNTSSEVKNSYALGDVEGDNYVGGLVGDLSNSSVKYCYSTGNVIGTTGVGGLVGFNYQSTAESSFWDMGTSNQANSVLGTGKTTAEMQLISTYTDAGWDFVGESANGTGDIWDIDSGYPIIVATPEEDETLPVQLSSFDAIATSSNTAQLNWSTASESNLLGYNIYRNENMDSQTAQRINSNLITAYNFSTGSDYTYIDDEIDVERTYYYWLESLELSNENSLYGPVSVRIETVENDNVLPAETILFSAYPNPFNPQTTIKFNVKENDQASLTIFNSKGQVVKSLGNYLPGQHTLVWNGQNNQGKNVSSGVYFYQLKSSGYSKINKMMLMK